MLGEVFDPQAELIVTEGLRPHWSQAGAIVFVTFRTHDSIPQEVLDRWDREKNEWMWRRGYSTNENWSDTLPTLDTRERAEFKKHFDRCREESLDSCHGRCILRSAELATIVADSLLYFDGKRYRMGDFVIMPNHVHLLAAFPSAQRMREQFDSWLHYSAFRINQLNGEKGRFWQQEPFDHLVRSAQQYEYLRNYIADNPKKAQLKVGEFLYRKYEP